MSDQGRGHLGLHRFPEGKVPAWVGYVVAAAATILMTAALDALRPVFPGVLLLVPYILLGMAIAYYFGAGPALVSVLLAIFGQNYVYVSPIHHLWPPGRNSGEMTRFWFFVGGLVAAAWAMVSIRKLTLALRAEIAEHVRAEEELRQSRADLARAQEIAHIGSWRLDIRRDELTWSDESYEIFAVEKGTPLTYELFLSFVHPDDRDYVKAKWQDALNGEPYKIEHRIIAGDGSVKWIRETAEAELGPGGEPLGGFGTAQDITESVLLRKELERDRQRLSAMYAVAEIGITATGLQDVMAVLAARIREIMHAHSSAVFTYDEETGKFVAKAESNIPGLVGTTLDATAGSAEVFRRERRPMYIADAEHDTTLQDQGLRERHIKAMLAAPLIARGRLIGMVRVDELRHREFAPDEMETLEVLAARAALIIENTELLESLTSNYQLLQRALLPPKPPEIPGCGIAATYLPGAQGAEIGGDFYDVFLTEDDKLAVLIGDVTGKGVPSASLAAATRSTLRAFAFNTSCPSESLKHTDAVVSTEMQDSSLFVTAFLAVIDHRTGRVRYSNAGHPPAAIWHKSDGEVEFARFGDPPIGLAPTYGFEENEVVLSPGDKIVFYTDGLTEARHDGEILGQERVREIIREVGAQSPEDAVSALVTAACDWSNQNLHDDLAIVIIECLA